MSNPKIHISHTGGVSNFGNVFQGDNNNVNTNFSSNKIDTDKIFCDLSHLIDNLHKNSNINCVEIANIKQDLEEFRSKITKNEHNDTISLGKKAKKIYEDYGLAAGALKNVFDIVVPGWLQ